MGERQGVKKALREAQQRERRLLEQMERDQQRRDVIPEQEAPRPKVQEGGGEGQVPRLCAAVRGPLVGSPSSSKPPSTVSGCRQSVGFKTIRRAIPEPLTSRWSFANLAAPKGPERGRGHREAAGCSEGGQPPPYGPIGDPMSAFPLTDAARARPRYAEDRIDSGVAAMTFEMAGGGVATEHVRRRVHEVTSLAVCTGFGMREW
jgi:hypothetical protein